MITGGPGRAAPELADSCSIYDHHGQCARLHAPGGGGGRSNCVSDGHTDRQTCNTRGRSDASDHRPVRAASAHLLESRGAAGVPELALMRKSIKSSLSPMVKAGYLPRTSRRIVLEPTLHTDMSQCIRSAMAQDNSIHQKITISPQPLRLRFQVASGPCSRLGKTPCRAPGQTHPHPTSHPGLRPWYYLGGKGGLVSVLTISGRNRFFGAIWGIKRFVMHFATLVRHLAKMFGCHFGVTSLCHAASLD